MKEWRGWPEVTIKAYLKIVEMGLRTMGVWDGFSFYYFTLYNRPKKAVAADDNGCEYSSATSSGRRKKKPVLDRWSLTWNYGFLFEPLLNRKYVYSLSNVVYVFFLRRRERIEMKERRKKEGRREREDEEEYNQDGRVVSWQRRYVRGRKNARRLSREKEKGRSNKPATGRRAVACLW